MISKIIRPLPILLFVLFSLVCGLNEHAIAEVQKKHSQPAVTCSSILDKNYRLVFSGRDQDVQADLEKYADMLFSKGGILEQLGMSLPPQIIQFLSGQDVNTIAANGRLPVGHWHDGANMINQNSRPGLIYEMVVHGGHLRHSIYRDDVPLKRQFSVLNHAAGHTHFGANTRWSRSDNVELNQAAYDFDAYLETLKKKYDHHEISDWYQYLLTLTYSQDLILGDYAHPKDFSQGQLKHPTANILQAFVANMPIDLPTWKIEMAKRFEEINRFIPGAIRTKIMNEGFATLMQELLPPHTGLNTFDHAMEYCCFISGVIAPSMSNPYWLGLEAWRNIRKTFNSRPEISNLNRMEQDKAFIAYATNDIIAKMDDAEFLRLGLNDNWISNLNLALTRVAKSSEKDPNLLPPSAAENPKNEKLVQHIIITREADRVREAIIRDVFYSKSYEIPRPVLTDIKGPVIRLELSDSVGRKVPLMQDSMVQTLYIMAKLQKKPVAIESTMEVEEVKESLIDPSTDVKAAAEELQKLNRRRAKQGLGPLPELPKNTSNNEEILVSRARVLVTVTPDGIVSAQIVYRDGSRDPDNYKLTAWQVAEKKGVVISYKEDTELSDNLQDMLEDFIADLDLATTDLKDLLPKNSLETIESTVSHLAEGVSPQLLMSVPTAPHAIEAYQNTVDRRLNKALHLSILGQRGISHRHTGVRLKVLPDIPYFSFDKSEVAKLKQDFTSPRADQYFKQDVLSLTVRSLPPSDKPLAVKPIKGQSGKRIWGPAPPKNGRGGAGAGKPQKGPAEPGEEPAEGNEAGAGGNDPTYVNINLETYAEALAAYVSLPNLRPKNGQSDMNDEVRGDWAKRRRGSPKSTMIARKAFEKGLAFYKSNPDKDTDPNKKSMTSEDIAKIYKKGFSLLDPAKDWVVESFTPEPSPQVNAQVTLIMDLSGSYAEYVTKTKQMFYDLRALLLKKYQNVTFRFVAFDGTAFAFEDPEEFFKLSLGGGTSYSVALNKTLEVQQQFPDSDYDRYVVLAGDMEDGIEDGVLDALEAVRLNSQFFASLRMTSNADPGDKEIEKRLRELHESDEFVSFVDLAAEGNEYTPMVLRRLFKNSDEVSSR